MCGRYTITRPERIAVEFEPAVVNADLDRPRYNIAPMQKVPALAIRADKRVLLDCQWGFVPHWATDPAIGSRMINARAETAADKPAFRHAFRHNRCLIPADGFYEWREADDGKQPMYIQVGSGDLFAFAGLYSVWPGDRVAESGVAHAASSGEEPPTGLPAGKTASCVIITTEPNDLLRPIHNRMPVILPRAAWSRWSDPAFTDREALCELLRPFEAGSMSTRSVSRRVNSPTNDDPACIAEFRQDSPAGQALF